MGAVQTSERGGRVEPRRLPPAYRAGLMASALVMLLLPAVYVAFIAAAGGLVWLWLVHGTFVLGEGGLLGVVFYAGPVFAGVVLIVFMLKPLFARPRRERRLVEVAASENPRLADYVRTISSAVGSPMPSEIRVDCEVNASASFRGGWLGLLRGELTLTIGLPLAAALEADEMAVVIAHEFGHFAQRGAMGASYIVNRLNAWFSRVVFERDRWDFWLVEYSNRGDGRLRLVFALARGGVWVGRRLLFWLMHAGRAATCFLTRQMEYDADYYAVRVAGRDAFLRLDRKLVRLTAASQRAQADLDTMWKERRLVDDLPALVAARAEGLAEDVVAGMRKAEEERPARWNDTHPTWPARRARAATLEAEGLGRFEGKASALFERFGELSKEATWHYFTEGMGLKVEREALVDLEEAKRVGDEKEKEQQVLLKVAPRILDCRRPIIPRTGRTEAPERLVAELTAARMELAKSGAALELAQREFLKETRAWDSANAARAFLEAGMVVRPEGFGVADSTLEAARRKLEQTTAARESAARLLAPGDAAFRAWLEAGLALASRGPVGAALGAELAETAALFEGLRPLWERMPDLCARHSLMLHLVSSVEGGGASPAVKARLNEEQAALEKDLDEALGEWGARTLPAALSLRRSTVSGYLELAARSEHPTGRLHEKLNAVYGLYTRLVGRMAYAIETIATGGPR